jgi:hypothetical protein
MKSRRFYVAVACALICAAVASPAVAQSPSVLYTWDNAGQASPNIESWIRGFGAANTTATLDNNTFGTLTITETSTALGGSQAFSDDFNKVRESSGASGGLDLTGLDYLEWDLGHNGAGNVNVQFYVQATTGSTFVALGPDLAVTPGVNTYQVPLTGLTVAQRVYVRTLGINIRDHNALGNLTWSVNEVRSGGTPLTHRDLVTHNVGSPEGGLQGAIVNFDGAGVLGNTGQNQTGLSHNPADNGSLQWTDLGGQNGGAISWGNGQPWAGNTFNNRVSDLSNYQRVLIRMSATEITPGAGGTVNVQNFFQTGPSFTFQAPQPSQALPIDGKYHNLVYSLAGLTSMNVVDLTGINLGSHATDLRINVDLVRFIVPEPGSLTLLLVAMSGWAATGRRRRS